MFKTVSFDELIYGKKYKITNKPNDKSPYFGVFICDQGHMQQFDFVFRLSPYGKIKIGDCLFINRVYYEFIPQKDKIQKAMEKRALIKVLGQLGIEHFDW